MNPMVLTATGWRMGRIVTTDDAAITSFEPAKYVAAQSIDVSGFSAIALRAFGTAADSLTLDLRLIGWMDHGTPATHLDLAPGPGQVLWYGVLTTGTVHIAARPTADRHWTDTTWHEVATWNSGGGSNACAATVMSGGGQSLILVPVLGYRSIMFEFTNMGGAGEMASCGILWRGVSAGNVL